MDVALASRARDLEPRATKVGFPANTLANIPSFRHEQDLNPGGSRMEIYETISHVSTNQVWLHINSASSRVYFRPIALFSFVGSAGAGQLARSYLCLESLSTLLPSPSPSHSLLSHPQTRPPFPVPQHPPFLLPYPPYTWHAPYSRPSLLFFALEIVYLNHPRLPTSTNAPF